MSGVRLCRICLAAEGAGELIPIFENNADIAKQIFLCSGVKVCLAFLVCDTASMLVQLSDRV